MDSRSKRKEVTALIDSIKEHSDRLKDDATIPMLEMSVILSKINRLHESTLILKYLLATEQHTEDLEFGGNTFGMKPLFERRKELLEEEELEQKEAEVIAKEVHEKETKEENLEEEVLESTELEDGEEIIVEMEIEEEEQPEEIEEGKEDHHEPVSEIANLENDDSSISESVDQMMGQLDREELDQKPDVNEHFAQVEDNSIVDRLQSQPITDLVAAIGLNERYLYANELFEGDLELFKSELNSLNEMESFDKAKDYFEKELMQKRAWEQDHEMVIALQNLLQRRFI